MNMYVTVFNPLFVFIIIYLPISLARRPLCHSGALARPLILK